MTRELSTEQRRKAEELAEQYGIDSERILFLNEERPLEPWFPAEELMSIARQSGGFQSIEETFTEWVPGLNHVIHQAVVIDGQGRSYKRSGVATMGEEAESGPDEHQLAASRAISAVLRAAGFHPLKSGAVVAAQTAGARQVRVQLEVGQREVGQQEGGKAERSNSIAQIHLLAEKAGLIIYRAGEKKEMSDYRAWLLETFDTETAASLDEKQRAQAVHELRRLAGEIKA